MSTHKTETSNNFQGEIRLWKSRILGWLETDVIWGNCKLNILNLWSSSWGILLAGLAESKRRLGWQFLLLDCWTEESAHKWTWSLITWNSASIQWSKWPVITWNDIFKGDTYLKHIIVIDCDVNLYGFTFFVCCQYCFVCGHVLVIGIFFVRSRRDRAATKTGRNSLILS